MYVYKNPQTDKIWGKAGQKQKNRISIEDHACNFGQIIWSLKPKFLKSESNPLPSQSKSESNSLSAPPPFASPPTPNPPAKNSIYCIKFDYWTNLVHSDQVPLGPARKNDQWCSRGKLANASKNLVPTAMANKLLRNSIIRSLRRDTISPIVPHKRWSAGELYEPERKYEPVLMRIRACWRYEESNPNRAPIGPHPVYIAMPKLSPLRMLSIGDKSYKFQKFIVQKITLTT